MIPIDLAELQDAAIYHKVREEVDYGYPLRPSSAGFCTRKLAYSLQEYLNLAKYDKPYFEPDTYRLLKFGQYVEESAIENFELIPNAEFKYKQQVVSLFNLGDRLVEGSIDVCLKYKDEYYVIDVKSKGDRFSKSHASKWDEEIEKFNNNPYMEVMSEGRSWYVEDLESFIESLNDPYFANNFYQLNAYCFSSFFTERKVQYAILYRYNKNNSKHVAIHFKINQKVFDRVKDKFQLVHDTITSGKDIETVPKDYTLGSMACAFCDYRNVCHDTDALKAYFQTFPKKAWPVNVDKIPKPILGLISRWVKLDESIELKTELESTIATKLTEANITKFRTEDGKVYEIKFLKSPKPHFEIRRSKA